MIPGFRLFAIAIFLLTAILTAQDYDAIRASREKVRAMERDRHARLLRIQGQADITPNQREWDVSAYRLTIAVWPTQQRIDGHTVIEGHSLVPGLSHLEIDLYSNMTVDSVRADTTHLSWTRSGNRIDVQLPDTLDIDGAFAVAVHYRGNPQNVGLGAWQWSSHNGTPIISTLSEPFGSPAWWACKDDPADKADSAFITVNVPDNLVVASNGLLMGVTPDGAGRHTYAWETRYPISQYLISLAITNYAQFNDWYVSASGDSMELLYFVYPEHLTAAQQDFAVTDDMIGAFAGLFGEYPFIEEKYGMAIFTWGGAMEHQTMTSYGAGLITGNNTYDWINAHELAHQWFGDMITMRRWSHIWLNEGFASYSEALWHEHLYGETGYHNYMASQYRNSFDGSLFVVDSTSEWALFSNTVYDKGSWVLHMLRGVMGDGPFFASLNAYANDSSLVFGNALTEDFRDICETVSGMELDWFFDQWVYRAGRPHYEYDWTATSSGGIHVTTLTMNQTTPDLWTMPLRIRLTSPGNDSTITVWDSLRTQQFSFITDWDVLQVAVDPDDWVLKRIARVTGLPVMAGTAPDAFHLDANYPNPFNPSTTIAFGLSRAEDATLAVYDIRGQRVRTVMDRSLAAGTYQVRWDGRDDHGRAVASGVYFYRLSTPTHQATRRMLLIR